MNVIKPAIISEHFREYRSPIRTLEKKNDDVVYLCTGFTMLPLHRNDGMKPKRRLAYATEIADFYRMQIVVKKILSRGQNGRVGRVSGNKTFFFGPNNVPTVLGIHPGCISRKVKIPAMVTNKWCIKYLLLLNYQHCFQVSKFFRF